VDKPRAFELYKLASDQRSILLEGVEMDKKKAFDRFTMLAEQGKPDALYNLGAMYLRGEGVEFDTRKVNDFFQRAADKGHVLAKEMLKRYF